MSFDLKGKVSLVTGACRGIGRACAEILAKNGSEQIGICCRHKEHIDKASVEIRNKFDLSVNGFVADLSKPNDIQNMTQSMLQSAKRVDILVINTGTPAPGTFSQCSATDWLGGIALCLNSTIQLCKEIIPSMKENKFGRIIMLTSIFAKEPDSNFVISSTLRSSLLTLTKCLAGELAPFGVTVNAICQGYTDTSLLREVAEEQAILSGIQTEAILHEWQEGIPLKRFARPEEIGHLVAFLASEQGAYITGTSITIDGGVMKGIL